MQINGTREQLAAVLVEGQDSLPGPSLAIGGTPGDWSVCVNDTNQHTYWLATERTKTQMRRFKSLDGAHASAIAIHQLAFPCETNKPVIRVAMVAYT